MALTRYTLTILNIKSPTIKSLDNSLEFLKFNTERLSNGTNNHWSRPWS